MMQLPGASSYSKSLQTFGYLTWIYHTGVCKSHTNFKIESNISKIAHVAGDVSC